jgi:hypothetical protein
VFPDVNHQQRLQIRRERSVRIIRLDHPQPRTVENQPGPPGAELGYCRGAEFLLE